MLAWEYPPFVVGGIAAHVDGLSRALVRSGHEVVVLSRNDPISGMRVFRSASHYGLTMVADVAKAAQHLRRSGGVAATTTKRASSATCSKTICCS